MKLIILVISVILLFSTVAFADSNKPNPNTYDGTASYTINYVIPSWTLVQSSNVLYVRSLRFEVTGTQIKTGVNGTKESPPYFFACWFQGAEGLKLIDEVMFMPKLYANTASVPQEITFNPPNYPKGLPSPQPNDSIVCGWQLANYGIPLVYGFAHVYLVYQEG